MQSGAHPSRYYVHYSTQKKSPKRRKVSPNEAESAPETTGVDDVNYQ